MTSRTHLHTHNHERACLFTGAVLAPPPPQKKREMDPNPTVVGQVRGRYVRRGIILRRRHELLSVDGKEAVERPLADVQGRQMRQEIVADQESHEHEVVNHALQIQLAERRWVW